MLRFAPLLMLSLVAALGLPVARGADTPTREDTAPSPRRAQAEAVLEEWRARVETLYREAREAGETAAEDAATWVREDLESIGDWEYRVVDVLGSLPSTLEPELTALGAERWECYFVERLERAGAATYRLWLKRPKRTVAQAVPLRELLRLFPGGGE